MLLLLIVNVYLLWLLRMQLRVLFRMEPIESLVLYHIVLFPVRLRSSLLIYKSKNISLLILWHFHRIIIRGLGFLVLLNFWLSVLKDCIFKIIIKLILLFKRINKKTISLLNEYNQNIINILINIYILLNYINKVN
jgi:hypothetical protein